MKKLFAVFGGGSIESRKLHVYGKVSGEAGKAAVRLRQNEEVTKLEPQKDGSFETTISCSSGENYIMVDYKNFQGNVELYSEYISDESEK